jgi:hypothetical protein
MEERIGHFTSARAVAALAALLHWACSEAPPERVISAVPREAIAIAHAVLLLPRPSEALVPELFDCFEIISQRAATGEIAPHWAAHLYTNYYLDMVRDRPNGQPRRSPEEIRSRLDADIEFYYIRKRPEARPSPVGDWVFKVRPAPLGQ